MYDIVFLSYNEHNAEEHWKLLKEQYPRAIRVDGVSGIIQAHKTAARACRTDYFWLVDVDNVLADDFSLDFEWDKHDHVMDRVSVWRAINNVNGLIYGYGGIKLLPRKAVLEVPNDVVDFTTSISKNFHVMNEVASMTIIDSTPFEAWKSGFRECAKLGAKIHSDSQQGIVDGESKERLARWMTPTNKTENSVYCVRGALSGYKYGSYHGGMGSNSAMSKLNDWKWLNNKFMLDQQRVLNRNGK